MQAPHCKTSPSMPRNYSKMPVARSSVPTHSRHNKPSLLRTFVIAVLYLALASAPVSAALNLVYVGVGACKDASGNYYDYVYTQDSSGNRLTGTALFDFCRSWCGQNPNGLVGIDIYEFSGYSQCMCRFSDPLPSGLTTESYSPAGSSLFTGYSGIGPVKSSNGFTNAKCYSVQVRSLVFLYQSPHLLSQSTNSFIPLFSRLHQTP